MNADKQTITINGARKLVVQPGNSLFATLRNEQIYLPSICGGRGACGKCRITIPEDAGKPTAKELRRLTPENISAGIRLACQVTVDHDLSIVIPDELLGTRTFETEVADMRELTHDIRELKLKLLRPPTIQFKPGQHMLLKVPPYGSSTEAVFRPYSIASDPGANSETEFEVKYSGGISTTYVFKRLKVGDQVELAGPDGEFSLSNSGRDAVFIAGASGMAPIRSILFDMVRRNDQRRCRYYFGAKSQRDLFHTDEMKRMEQALPHFEFLPALSEPAPDDNWTGETGLISEVVDRRVESITNLEAYLCGSPPMIEACISVLRRKGLPDNRIFFDRFVPADR